MTLTEYYNQLEMADWHYEMSDSQATYRRGAAAMSALHHRSCESPKHKELYEAFLAYANGRGEKPKRPFVTGTTDIKPGE